MLKLPHIIRFVRFWGRRRETTFESLDMTSEFELGGAVKISDGLQVIPNVAFTQDQFKIRLVNFKS